MRWHKIVKIDSTEKGIITDGLSEWCFASIWLFWTWNQKIHSWETCLLFSTESSLFYSIRKGGSESCSVMSDSLQPMDYSVHEILQARILEWVAVPFSRGSSKPRNWTQVSHIAGEFFTRWATRGSQEYWCGYPLPSPVDRPCPGMEPRYPALQSDSLPAELPGKQWCGEPCDGKYLQML